MEVNKVFLKNADCALDLGDGSERGFYVNQDYIMHKIKKIHRGISLMYSYYPNDEQWPTRARFIKRDTNPKYPWASPYEDYFPYRGGREGLLDDEPFKSMQDIRRHGQDVVLTITIDPFLTEKDIILLAKDLIPYGRVFLRINHECTGSWFCYTRRASYQQIASFFVMCCNVMHKYAPNVKMILCAGMWDKNTGKLDMEDIFLEAHKAADIWSCDNYLSLHWGWPVDIAKKGKEKISFDSYNVDEVYTKYKNTYLRLKEITGQDKPIVISEINADGDVNGPYDQAKMIQYFMEKLENDKEKWLSSFTLYQFRDDGRLGLEVTDPNNNEVGIEQPILSMYRSQIQNKFFSSKIIFDKKIDLPATIRWSNSEDAEGLEITLSIQKNPHFAEIYFNEALKPLNLIIEFDGYWFYKAPGTKCIDFMSYFFDHKIENPVQLKMRFFAPPADGKNHKQKLQQGVQNDDSWIFNQYITIPEIPDIRIEYEPIMPMSPNV